mgnify:CR=1 FL=1
MPVPIGATRVHTPEVASSVASPTVQPLSVSSGSQVAAGTSVNVER